VTGPDPAPSADPARAAARREMGLVAGLCAVGGGLALFAAGPDWVTLTAARGAPLPDVVVGVTGRSLEPLVPGLGIVGLAGVVGLLATRAVGRLAVAALVTLAGVGVLVTALTRLGPPGEAAIRTLLEDSGRSGVTAGAALSATTAPAWPLLAAAGGLLLAAGGAVALARSRRWPAMGARYETPAARRAAARPRTDAALWDALDRGDDPTR
jgi:uncharacterized membrane protein (TIGR02234 family)